MAYTYEWTLNTSLSISRTSPFRSCSPCWKNIWFAVKAYQSIIDTFQVNSSIEIILTFLAVSTNSEQFVGSELSFICLQRTLCWEIGYYLGFPYLKCFQEATFWSRTHLLVVFLLKVDHFFNRVDSNQIIVLFSFKSYLHLIKSFLEVELYPWCS